MTAAPPSVTALRPAVPAAVVQILERALAKRAADRFATAVQFAEALAEAASRAATETPPPPAGAGPANNLPRQRTHFIGREKELAECARLLTDTRVLTLTGIGGCGKTRLALELGGHVLSAFPDGAWFADFAPLNDGARVWETAAAALGVREIPGIDLQQALCGRVAGRRLLLILDNCEHVLSDASALADRLLEAGEALRIVATSREGLGIDGERLFPIRSLAVPAANAPGDPTAIRSTEAVSLFVDRAQRVVRDFEVTAGNASAIGEICRRLDGIPLAIELAAARVKVLSVEQIRDRLDDRFRLLTGGARSALARHQTLQAAIEWSHDQLTTGEQRLFRQLSVFAGGWTLEAVARVAGAGMDEFEVLDLVSRLIDKSLVLVDRHLGEPRYAFLETVRQYARDRLKESGESGTLRRLHAEVFLSLAERAYDARLTDEDRWSAALEADHDNLRAALDYLAVEAPEGHLQLAGALAWFWQARSYLAEGREQLTAAIAATSDDPARRARARALSGAAGLLALQGDKTRAADWWRQALLGWRQVGDVGEMALALEGAGWAEFLAGADEQACATFEECLRLQQAAGNPHLVNRAMVALGQMFVALNRVEEARACAAEILKFSRAHHDTRGEHSAWHYLADCALIEGQCADSVRHYRESLRLANQLGDRVEIGAEVQGIAMSLAGLGAADLALRLAAGIEAEWERIGADIAAVRFWTALLDRYLGSARAAAGGDAARIWSEGRAMTFDETVALALSAAAESRVRVARPF